MKRVLLSAGNEIGVFLVPDKVADHLRQYCLDFCCNWLYTSPDAAKYRVKIGKEIGLRYCENDFIDYLNQYICDEPSMRIKSLTGVYTENELPKEYIGLPYFHF